VAPSRLPKTRKPAGTSVANPWVLGTQLGTQFYGDEGLRDDLLVGAKFVYPVVTGTLWELATFGNFASFTDEFDADDEEKKSEAVSNLLTSSRGMLVGAQLYRSIAVPNQNWIKVVPFGQLDFRLSRAKVTDTAAAGTTDDREEAKTLLQRRAGFGGEVHIGNQGDGHRPLTLSFSRTRTWADSSEFAAVFGDRSLPRYVNEYTAVLPISKRFGIVAEMTRGEKNRDVYRIAMLVVTGGGDDPAPPSDTAGDKDTSGDEITLTVLQPESAGGTIVASWGDGTKSPPCTISGKGCDIKVPKNVKVTLTATPNDESTRAKWPGLAGCKETEKDEEYAGATCTRTYEREAEPFTAPFVPRA
jgi:hypothetical protein